MKASKYYIKQTTALHEGYPANSVKKNFLVKSWILHTYLFIAIALFSGTLLTQNTYAGVTGPGASWQYVRKITLSTATPLTNFQVKVTLTTALLGKIGR